MEAKIYDISQTANNAVNLQKLDLEIRASEIEYYVTPVYQFGGNRIYVEFEQTPTAAHLLILDGIIAAHDGANANISEKEVNAREGKIRELTQMAIFHPLLDNVEATRYLTSIDNHFNAWKRSGITDVLVEQITADAANVGHPQHGFLNEVVNPEGNTTSEFLLSMILG